MKRDRLGVMIVAIFTGDDLLNHHLPDIANGQLIQPFDLSVDEPANWIQVTKRKPEPGSAVYLFAEWLQQVIDYDLNFKTAR